MSRTMRIKRISDTVTSRRNEEGCAPEIQGASLHERQARRRMRSPASSNTAPAARRAGSDEAVFGNLRAEWECGAGGAGAGDCATSTGEAGGAIARGAGAGVIRAEATGAWIGAGPAAIGASTLLAVVVIGATLVLADAELAAVLEKSMDLRSMISPARFLARKMSE